MHHRWQDILKLIKEQGWLTSVSEGQVLVAPPGFFVLQLASQDSMGLRWGVDFPNTDAMVCHHLAELILAHPSLQASSQGSFHEFLVKATALAAAAATPVAGAPAAATPLANS